MNTIHVGLRDHRTVGCRVFVEWAGVTEEVRGMGSLAAFKRRSKAGFLKVYGGFVCVLLGCRVCRLPEN